MRRRYNTANQYNIIGFCDEFQEFIRIVRYVPENRLVCVICLFDGGFWNHSDDIKNESKYVVLPPESAQIVFEEVSYEEVAAAGWDKYLRVFRTDYDFNETSIHAAHKDTGKLTLTMWGGFIAGRRLYTESIPRTNRFYLHIYKPYTINKGVFRKKTLPKVSQNGLISSHPAERSRFSSRKDTMIDRIPSISISAIRRVRLNRFIFRAVIWKSRLTGQTERIVRIVLSLARRR